MWWTSRRSFVQSLGAAFSALLVPRPLWGRSPAPRIDPVRLRAVADATLPSELGGGGVETIVEGFLGWVADYRPGAELSHGYGSGSMEIRYLPPDPAPRWEAQLQDLQDVAMQRFGSGFPELSREQQRLILREELAGEAMSGLSSPAEADHVGTALMAFYFGSASATDLAYGALIQREKCRSLSTVGEKPPPIGPGG